MTLTYVRNVIFLYYVSRPLLNFQDPQRVFTNNIVVRFHPALEMDGDEVITIVCRYPPPIAPPPAGLSEPRLVTHFQFPIYISLFSNRLLLVVG